MESEIREMNRKSRAGNSTAKEDYCRFVASAAEIKKE